jgi:L-2,4-diaminobutyrate decarboxylase
MRVSEEPLLSGGPSGAARVRALAAAAMDAVAGAAAARPGPIPGGGPAAVAATLATALAAEPAPVPVLAGAPTGTATVTLPAGPPAGEREAGILPEHGIGEVRALEELSRLLTAGSVDPGHPWCAAHLHGPTLAVAAAADLVGSVLNPSMDSWDQAPVASELEREVTRALARLCFPAAAHPDALLTSGGTESNLAGLLLARESGRTEIVCGRNAHHSIACAPTS